MSAVATHRKCLTRMHETVERNGRFFARRNGVDCKFGTGIAVTADKDIALVRLVCERIGESRAFCVSFQFSDVQIAPVDYLTDRADHAVEFDGLESAGADRLSASFFVRFPKFHDLYFHSADLAVVSQNFDGSAEEAEFYTLGLGFLDFITVGGHFLFSATIDDIGLVSAETYGRAAHVHRDVASADDGAATADFDLVAQIDFTKNGDLFSAATPTPQRNCTPISLRMSISALRTSFSRRKFGIPSVSMPPGTGLRSNTVTG